jgi:hypothetical protein
VLGPLLFLIFINDITKNTSSNVRLFVASCLLYRTINCEADAKTLQKDLDTMQQWEAEWLMEFNPNKCEVITITNKRSHINYPYNIHGKELKHVQHAKYLGLTFSNNLSWNKHIDNVTKKANATCAFLRRNINSCSRQVKAQCYTTLVRPNLEYAATVWDPYTKFNINKLEKCQRRAARFVIGDYSRESSVTSMLKELKWPTLQQRRTNTKMVMMYRIVHHLIVIPSQMYLTPARGHHQKFQIPFSRIQSHQNSYFTSAIRTGNNLPAVLISVPTLEAFKVELAHV